MRRVVSCIATLHNLWLVGLAALVCVAGGWVTFSLYRRARERHGYQSIGWHFLAAVAAGASVWCTHFIAILAYEVGAPVTFDPILTLVSLLIVIAGSAAAIVLAGSGGRAAGLMGGAVLGFAIAAMRYSGMMAYHVDGIVGWDSAYVAASVAIAMTFGALAMEAAHIDGFEIVSGASIGISVHPQDGDTPARLVGNADLAMYRAKADVSRSFCF